MTQANHHDARAASTADGVGKTSPAIADERAKIDGLYFGGHMTLDVHAERSLALLQAHQKNLDAALPAALAMTRQSPAALTDVNTFVQPDTPASSTSTAPADDGGCSPVDNNGGADS